MVNLTNPGSLRGEDIEAMHEVVSLHERDGCRNMGESCWGSGSEWQQTLGRHNQEGSGK